MVAMRVEMKLFYAARDLGRPWDLGKGFDHSAVCGQVYPVSRVGHLSTGMIRLSVNGEVRQDADLDEMIWKIPEQIAILSRSMKLSPGDLIYSGTPAGASARCCRETSARSKSRGWVS